MSSTEPSEHSTNSNSTEGEITSTVGTPLEPSAGQAPGLDEPSLNTSAPPQKAKTKGVADIVFMVDVTGSMSPCIDALRANIEIFIDSLSKGEANNAPPVRDWRGKVVGTPVWGAPKREGLPWLWVRTLFGGVGGLKDNYSQFEVRGVETRRGGRFMHFFKY